MNWKFSGDRPVYQQIMELMRGGIVKGELPPGGKIPSVRELAAQAQVNPNTMQRAMTELEREGLLVSGGTSGRTVTENPEVLEKMREAVLQELARECAEKFMVFGITPSQAAQLLLEPVVVELSAEEKTALLANLDLLENAGLEIDDFGGNSVFLRSVPADVEQGSAEDLLVELADKLSKGSRDALSEKTEWVLHSISCRAAIKAGDKTSPQELMALAEKILSGEVPPFCPHGRPCVLKLTRKELEKQFGRIV